MFERNFLGHKLIYFAVIIGKYISKMRLATGKMTDERLQISQETFSTFRIIKMYTWEAFFGEKITEARK